MVQSKKFYVTTPIYYGTAKPHLGSLYSTLLADIMARWQRLQGKKVFFLTGTDEHGQKIAQAAAAAGKEPKQFVDHFVQEYKKLWQHYNIAYDMFIRTTDPGHVKGVYAWIDAVQKKGDIYKSVYSGWYCTPCETFLTDVVAQEKSKEPLCPSCNRETSMVAEDCYFFRLSAYQDRLLAFYEQHPDFITPKERANEVISFVKAGLRDLSISRTTVKWGIPFPGDPDHVVYVWADALNNYISAIGYGQPQRKKEFDFWWPADLQIVGKDIVRFHAIFWPAFLMAADMALPQRLLVHGWIKIGEQKMSKSLGNAVDPEVLLQQYGVDAVRYYLARYIAITHDTEFSIQELEKHVTSDLANDLGNLLNRVVVLALKHNLATVLPQKKWSSDALVVRTACNAMLNDYAAAMNDGMLHIALARLWKFIQQLNSYFHANEPWKVAAKDPVKFAEIISVTCHSLHAVALCLWPVMPAKMEQLLQALGSDSNIIADKDYLGALVAGKWETSFNLTMSSPLFEKIVAPAPEATPTLGEKKMVTPEQNVITIDAVAAVELRVGIIEQCEVIEGSDKLYKLLVQFGEHGNRTILAGIRKFYTPEQLIGKQSIFVMNLKPRAMMGVESQGMMLLAKNADGTLVMVSPTEKVVEGSRLQ